MRGSARNRLAQHDVPIHDTILARAPPAGQPLDALPPTRTGSPYGFLVRAGISEATLAIAEAEARQSGTATHDVLICAGHMSPMAYASAVAGRLGVPLAGWDAAFALEAADSGTESSRLSLSAQLRGKTHRVLCSEDGTPDALGQRVAALQGRGLSVALSSRVRLDAALEMLLQPARLDHAISGLARQRPACSAAGPIWTWQIIAVALAAGLIAGGLSIFPHATLTVLSAAIAVPFLCVTLLRVIALREVLASSRAEIRRLGWSNEKLPETLPLYTILVPLFQEVKVLPGLVQSLQTLVYPRTKLEILLILESIDIETQAAVLAMRLPGNFRVVIVPDQAPRTKPKALNYALQFAHGDYVVVYDAEDRPEPDQLVRALAAFERGPPQLGCVQAQLNIYNPHSSWLTRGIMAQTPLEMNPSAA